MFPNFKSHDQKMSARMAQTTYFADGNCDSKTNLAYELKIYKELAKDLLLFQDFKNCQKTCLNGIAYAKVHIEDVRARDCVECLCVLCIQALAEMNKWQEVLPLVQSVYTGIETSPYTVVQLCILLHAKVKEFTQCHAIASIWLRCEDNSVRSGYDQVASLYIKNVMLPQGQFILVSQFLNSCTSLDDHRKQQLIEECDVLVKRRSKLSDDHSENVKQTDDDKSSKVMEDKSDVEGNTGSDFSLMKFAKSLGSMISSKLSYPSIQVLLKVAIVAVSFSLLAKLVLQGDLMSHLGQATVIWQATMKVLKSVFTPYRPGR